MTTWMRCDWDEEPMWFYFKVDAEGWVTLVLPQTACLPGKSSSKVLS